MSGTLLGCRTRLVTLIQDLQPVASSKVCCVHWSSLIYFSFPLVFGVLGLCCELGQAEARLQYLLLFAVS